MPYGVIAMMATFGPPNIISPVASVVPSLLAKSSTVINPVIYILMNKQVRQQSFSFLVFWINLKWTLWGRRKKTKLWHVQHPLFTQ